LLHARALSHLLANAWGPCCLPPYWPPRYSPIHGAHFPTAESLLDDSFTAHAIRPQFGRIALHMRRRSAVLQSFWILLGTNGSLVPASSSESWFCWFRRSRPRKEIGLACGAEKSKVGLGTKAEPRPRIQPINQVDSDRGTKTMVCNTAQCTGAALSLSAAPMMRRRPTRG